MKKLIKENWYWILMTIGFVYFIITNQIYYAIFCIILANMSFFNDDIKKLKKENDYLKQRCSNIMDRAINNLGRIEKLEKND